MGFLSCCTNDKKQAHNDTEARHARIVQIYTQAADDAQHPTSTPPPSYYEIAGDCMTHGMATIIEKEQYPPPTELVPQERLSVPSPRTSICSVPSTRLTDVTSAHTGATNITIARPQNDESMRSSVVFDSAPPSYYDGRSIRERSRSPDNQRHSERAQHPVTTEDWLEALQRTSQAAENYIRRLQGH